ncbi:MAG: hypothetical protein WD733_03550 [Bryobacterales bacterium]
MKTEADPGLNWLSRFCGFHGTPTDRRNARMLNFYTLIWVLVFLLSLKVMETYGDENLAVATAALAAAALAWIPVVWAYLRYLREADELLRMIHVQAMAVAFGVGFCLVLLDRFLVRIASLMPESPSAVKLLSVANPLLMAFAFSITIFVLQRRYAR